MKEEIISQSVCQATRQLQFKNVTDEHINELASIYNYYVINTVFTLHEEPLSDAAMKNILCFKDARSGGFTVLLDSRIAGYISLTKHKIREAYRDTGEIALYLHKDFLRKGIGREALKFIERFAAEKKYHTLIAAVSSDNSGSIKLFESSGYTKCAHFKEVAKKFGSYLDICSYQKIISS